MKVILQILSLLLLTVSLSCSKKLQVGALEAENIQVRSDHNDADYSLEYELLDSIVTPFRDSMNESMNEVLALAAVTMDMDQPESLLGNMVADLMVEEFEEATGITVDLAMTNAGGLRISALDSGEITRGEIYELMPFDNTMVMATVDSAQLTQLVEHSLRFGGWPVSKEIQIIQEAENVSILIGGKPITQQEQYRVLVNNYMASGGSNCGFIRQWEKKEYPFLLRDMIIEYLIEEQESGNRIRSELSSRVVQFE